jgi:hypothetical protein
MTSLGYGYGHVCPLVLTGARQATLDPFRSSANDTNVRTCLHWVRVVRGRILLRTVKRLAPVVVGSSRHISGAMAFLRKA